MKSLITLMLLALAIPAIGNLHESDCCPFEKTDLLVDRDSGNVEDEAETALQQSIKATMIGKWESTVYPFNLKNGKKNSRLEGAFLQYTFRPDGTYAISYGDVETRFEEKGTWNISANGKEIELKARNSKKSQTIIIKYLEFDELVLQHAYVNRIKPFSPGDKSVFFHKS